MAVLRGWDLEVVVALEDHSRMEASKPDMGSSEFALDKSAAFWSWFLTVWHWLSATST